MKHILFALLLSIPAMATQVGEPAPDFTLESSKGKKVSLKDYKDKVVILEWTNQDCPFVKKHYSSKNMQTLQGESVGKGVVWLTIISSAPGKQGNLSAAEAEKIRSEKGFQSSEVLLDADGKVGHLYNAKTTPHLFIIGKDGKLAYQGAIDDHPSTDAADIAKSKNYVREALTAILAGQKVSSAQTTPYGCSVKY